jgi:hypothetical protein
MASRWLNRLAAARDSTVGAPIGATQVVLTLRRIARAREVGDPVQLHAALIDLAGTALAWAEAMTLD